MKILKTKILDLVKIKLKSFNDKRGKFYETYNLKIYNKTVKKINFIQDDISISKKNVFRGFHGDYKTYKLTSCIFGKMIFFFIDNRKSKKSFGKIIKFSVSDADITQFLVPPGVGMATLTLSKFSQLSYKQSTYYDRKSQFTIKINSKKKIFKNLPKNLIISKRDN